MHPDIPVMPSMLDLMINGCSLEELSEMPNAFVEEFDLVDIQLIAERSTLFTFDEGKYSSDAILLCS